ncbi:MAG: sulfotransferase family 2 domain-containing protein [Pseudomonadota bacterium]
MSTSDKIDLLRALRSSSEQYLYRLEANTFVVEQLNLMYMDTPKAAGTSIKARLADFVGGVAHIEDSYTRETTKEMFVHDRQRNPLHPVSYYSDAEQAEILFSDSWNRICVVRNPYNRVFSSWFSKVLLREPGYIDHLPGYELPERFSSEQEVYRCFDQFIAYIYENGISSDPHWDMQFRLLLENNVPWTHVFKFENLQDQLLEQRAMFANEDLQLKLLNPSGMLPDWSLVSMSTLENIFSLYETDFQLYGYDKTPSASKGPTQTLLPTYLNAVIGRNRRLTQMYDRDDQKMNEIRSLKSSVADYESKVASLEETLALAGEKTKVLEAEVGELHLGLNKLNEEKEKVEAELDSLVHSNSWKLTAPLRGLRNIFRK